MTYTSQYPTQDINHVKVTSCSATGWPYYATDPSKSLVGGWDYNCWMTNNGFASNNRLSVDIGSEKVITKVYYENYHASGSATNVGAKDFTLWGSNSEESFGEVAYATDTGWTQLSTSVSSFDQHTASNVADPKYFLITTPAPYRYYSFKFANNYGHANLMGVRRIELQTTNPIVGTGYISCSNGGDVDFEGDFTITIAQ